MAENRGFGQFDRGTWKSDCTGGGLEESPEWYWEGGGNEKSAADWCGRF